VLGLDPIVSPDGGNGAVIGFIPAKFIAAPTGEQSSFKIVSDRNNLHVTGSGFSSSMATDFKAGPVTIHLKFKIIDDDYLYALFFKHWKTTATGCTLSFVFNGDVANPVIRHVDAMEAEGGDDNLTVVELRNKSYSAIDYHDYLVKGLNTIDVTISPDDPTQPAGYFLRAVAVGES
jgi:hypothetical protein